MNTLPGRTQSTRPPERSRIRGTAFEDPVDDATLSRLTQMLVGRFVVRDTALAPVDAPRTPAQPFTLTTGTDAVPAAATDSGLEQLFKTDGPPVLRVQRVLAGLAEIVYEAPSQAAAS